MCNGEYSHRKRKMNSNNLIVEKREYVFLKRLLNLSGYSNDNSVKKSLEKLSSELQLALIVDELDMPRGVIRFNSLVTIESSDGWQRKIQLVIPSERNFELGKISVLTPMGAALFGYPEGSTVEWEFPGGTKKIFISEVKKQPLPKVLDLLL
tara:strand:+ start:3923 stop:4378 length:456 start_codon:yes stop_codon:yes gene_type:complete